MHFDLTTIYLISWVLAGTCFIDWGSVKLEIREGTNGMRFITGAFLGIGYSMYFWLLPVDWLVKLGSLAFIQLIFTFLVYVARCKEYDIPLTKPFDLAREIATSHRMYQCDCGCGACCGSCCCPSICGASWWIFAIIACLCCCGGCALLGFGMGACCKR